MMKSNVNYMNEVKLCIILASIVGILTISGCGSIRNVRQFSNKNSNNNKEIDTTLTNQTHTSGIITEKKKANDKNSNINITSNNVNATPQDTMARHIPTLNEQIKYVQDKQTDTDNKIEGLHQEISEIKNSISELKNNLNNPNIKKASNKRAQSSVDDETYESGNTLESDENVILPDEKVLAKTSKNIKPSKAIKNKAISSNKQSSIKQVNSSSEKQIAKKENSNKEQKNNSTNHGNDNQDLQVAINDFSKGNYEGSINKLNQIVSTEKNSAVLSESYFLLGESYYNLKNYDKAIANYQSVITQRNAGKKDEAHIKLAECYIHLGQVGEAKKEFQNILAKYPQSEYIPRARKMLQQL